MSKKEKIMEKPDIKQNILDLLKSSKFGLNVKNIKDKLGYSRTTIAKYLDILEKDNLVFDQKIGQYRVWLHKDHENIKSLNVLIFDIYQSMLRNMEKDPEFSITPEKIKKMGMQVASDLHFSELVDTQLFEGANFRNFSSIADLLMKAIDMMCTYYDSYSWRPPIIIDSKNIIIVRMYDSKLISSTKYHFYMLSGFIEHAMNKMGKGSKHSVNVIKIDEIEKIVDFQFEF